MGLLDIGHSRAPEVEFTGIMNPAQRLNPQGCPTGRTQQQGILMSSYDSHTKNIQKQFNRQAEEYAQTKQAKDVRAMAGLVRLTKTNASSLTLDVACGPGRLTMAFANHAKQATGLDVTENLLNIARAEAAKLAIPNIVFAQGSALDIPFDNGTFDTVSCRAAFHHFAEPEQVLKEMARVLKPDGEMIIADILGNEEAAKAAQHDALEQLCDPTHVRCLSKTTFQGLFDATGLDVASCRFGTMDYEVEQWLLHGGPSKAQKQAIRSRFEQSVVSDETGLEAREDQGVLKFTHQTAVFVLAHADERLS
jgi:ubiquinone/menaquinone biosynthesis C-methylase UbiE